MKRKEAALVIIKPDGVYKRLEGDVLNKFAQAGLEIVGAKVIRPTKDMVENHYRHIKGKPFFRDVVDYLLGKFHHKVGVMIIVYFGPDAIKKCRTIAGATNPEDADPKTIRAAFGRITTGGVYENVVHVSSDAQEAEREIKLWFHPDDISTKLYAEKKPQTIKQRAWK